MGIKQVLSAPRSPWQRAYVERLIGSLRRECLDHMIVFGERSLRRALASYVSYYHSWRTHLSLGNNEGVIRPERSLQIGKRPPQKPFRFGILALCRCI
jgi:transposase InsO family protein